MAQHPGEQAIIRGDSKYGNPDAIAEDDSTGCNGPAQTMAGSSVPLMSFHAQLEGGAGGCSGLHVSRRPRQASRRLRLFYWVAPLWGLGPMLMLAGGGRLQWSGVAVAGRLGLPSRRRPRTTMFAAM